MSTLGQNGVPIVDNRVLMPDGGNFDGFRLYLDPTQILDSSDLRPCRSATIVLMRRELNGNGTAEPEQGEDQVVKIDKAHAGSNGPSKEALG